MKTRCKPGDMALVVRDTPACADNVGRLVRIGGPLAFNRSYRKQCWLIEPVVHRPYAVERRGKARRSIVLFSDRVEHPDCWLVPIAPQLTNLRQAKAVRGSSRRQLAASLLGGATLT
jgi:hypothetical protein